MVGKYRALLRCMTGVQKEVRSASFQTPQRKQGSPSGCFLMPPSKSSLSGIILESMTFDVAKEIKGILLTCLTIAITLTKKSVAFWNTLTGVRKSMLNRTTKIQAWRGNTLYQTPEFSIFKLLFKQRTIIPLTS